MLGWVFHSNIFVYNKKSSALHHKEMKATTIKRDYYIIEFLNLTGIEIKKIERKKEGNFLSITTRPSIHTCPCYKHKTKKIHDYRNQTIKDIPYQHEMVFFILRKRRYICKYCGKSFLNLMISLQNIFAELHVAQRQSSLIYLSFAQKRLQNDITL